LFPKISANWTEKSLITKCKNFLQGTAMESFKIFFWFVAFKKIIENLDDDWAQMQRCKLQIPQVKKKLLKEDRIAIPNRSTMYLL
jgi:hypothetical protein